MLEDILQEAKVEQAKSKYRRINKILALCIFLSLLIAIPSFTFTLKDFFSSIQNLIQSLLLTFLVSVPLILGFLSLFIAFIPIKEWSYAKKFYRIFLILYLLVAGISAIVEAFEFLLYALLVQA